MIIVQYSSSYCTSRDAEISVAPQSPLLIDLHLPVPK
jgi:hypothetical protein